MLTQNVCKSLDHHITANVENKRFGERLSRAVCGHDVRHTNGRFLALAIDLTLKKQYRIGNQESAVFGEFLWKQDRFDLTRDILKGNDPELFACVAARARRHRSHTGNHPPKDHCPPVIHLGKLRCRCRRTRSQQRFVTRERMSRNVKDKHSLLALEHLRLAPLRGRELPRRSRIHCTTGAFATEERHLPGTAIALYGLPRCHRALQHVAQGLANPSGLVERTRTD